MTHRRCTRSERSGRVRALAVLTLWAATGCGNVTAGGLGEATVFVTGNDEPAAPAPQPSSSALQAPPSPSSPDEAEEAEGTVEVEFMVFLVTDRGTQNRLGRDEIRVKVDLQGLEEPEVVSERIPAIRYTELLLVFTEIKVEVEGGLIINGEPIMGELHVELEDLSLPVTRAIDVDISEGQSVDLVVDLNAPAWLAALDPVTRTIDESVFAGLVNVVAR